MIEAAAILSAMVWHWADFAIILTLLIVNAVVGFWEEYQAGNEIAALQARLALNARVKRDGRWTSIPARQLVPGDIIRVRLGDIVPADAKLLEGDSVEVDQSALTGESLPVNRNAGETVYSGSIIKQGEIDALVYGTGGDTYFGRTAHLVETAHTASHFQQAVLRINDHEPPMDGVSKDEILLAAALASRAENQDAIDQAGLAGCDNAKSKEYSVVHFQPFDPVHKRTEATVHANDGGEFKTSKGAPQVILDLVRATGAIRTQVNESIDKFAARGFRALGVAQYDDHNQWRFLGGHQHTDYRDAPLRLRHLHGADWLGNRWARLGLCLRLVPRQRSHQVVCLSDFRRTSQRLTHCQG